MVAYQFRKVIYRESISSDGTYVLGADIGGTNANFGFFHVKDNEPELAFSWHFKSQEITDFTDLVVHLLNQVQVAYSVTVERACFAAAGVVLPEQDFCKPTNLKITISSEDLMRNSALVYAPIVNDFAVIGYGIDRIAPANLVNVYAGKEYAHANKAILGAGTGLGKSILRWVKECNRYVPVASEGGHADCALQNNQELELAQYIRESEGMSCDISWEDVLSGNGIQRMYRFFSQKNGNVAGNLFNPDEIFARRNEDKRAWQTFELYTTLYARCAKNFALDALALGGIYIAGGIAARNVHLFEQSAFYTELVSCGKQELFIREIPLWVIADYNVSLYGAAYYVLLAYPDF